MICDICGWNNDPLACMGQCRHALGEPEFDATGKKPWKGVWIPDWWPFEPLFMWPDDYEPVWDRAALIKVGDLYIGQSADEPNWTCTGDAGKWTVSGRGLLYVRKKG